MAAKSIHSAEVVDKLRICEMDKLFEMVDDCRISLHDNVMKSSDIAKYIEYLMKQDSENQEMIHNIYRLLVELQKAQDYIENLEQYVDIIRKDLTQYPSKSPHHANL